MATNKKKGPAPLDGIFHYRERGGTFAGEIWAGVGMAMLAVCGMFVNMQLLLTLMTSSYAESSSAQIATNGEYVALTWFVSMVVAFVGTLVMGLVARLPFVQVTSLSLSCVLVSTVSLSSGLSYYNMLAVVFVADLVYLVVAAVPQLRRIVIGAVPAAVRAALPAAAGLLMAWVAAQLTGLFQVSSSLVPNYGTAANLGSGYVALSQMTSISDYSYTTDAYHPQMLLSAVAVAVTLAVFAFSRVRSKKPYLVSLAAGTLFFLVAVVLLCCVNWNNMSFTLTSLWARLWMAGSEDAMQTHLSTVLANLGIAKVFTSGFDFSGYTEAGGNLGVLFASGVLSYVFLFMGDADSTVVAVAQQRGLETPDADAAGMPLMINAAANVVASVLGISPVALGKETVAGTRDRARSGLAATVAALVFLASAFVWVVPTLLATITSYSISFNMYGHYGSVLQLLSQCSFSVADTVMAVCGLSMTARSFAAVADELKAPRVAVPFMATVAGTLLTSNLAVGLAAGCVGSALAAIRAPRRKKSDTSPKTTLVERAGGVPCLVMAVVSLVLIVLVAL